MIRINKKLITLLVCVTLLLACSVSGTVAYLTDAPEGITNTFDPVKVEIAVSDSVSGYTKREPTVTNTGDVAAYIRVAVTGYWEIDGNIVGLWNAPGTLQLNSGWSYNSGDGFFYYKTPVAPGNAVVLFNSYEQPGTAPVAGAHLEMDIIAQAVQAEGMGVSDAQAAFTKAANAGN